MTIKTTCKSTSKPVNLNTIAYLLLANKNVITGIADQGIVFTANQLALKIPDLKPLGDMPLIQIYKNHADVSYRIPTLYQEDGQVVVISPDINASILKDFSVSEWQGGDVNQAVIVGKDKVCVTASIAFTPYVLDFIRQDHSNNLQGEGIDTLKADWLKEKPSLELPLRILPLNVTLTIVGECDRRSKKYNTQLVDIEDSEGNVFKNVITNADLRNLIAADCTQFKINSVKTVKVDKQNSKSNKEKTRTIHKVLLQPVVSADFSDF